MARARRDPSPSPQADLFGESAAPSPPSYRLEHEFVMDRLTRLLADMRRAESWPWSHARLTMNRYYLWPHLLRLLPEDESERWRADLEAEAERLDAAA